MILTADQLPNLLETLIPIIREAGRLIIEHRDSPVVEIKANDSPVTSADWASHYYLRESLRGLMPDIPVISEEGTEEDLDAELSAFWLVDPLDGTREFIEGSPDFAINIALIVASQPVLGLVYAPAKLVLYGATVVSSAWQRMYEDLSDTALYREEELSVLSAPLAADDTIVTLSRHFYNPAIFPYIQSYTKHIVFMGSTLKICAVAAGIVHLYARFGRTCFWDTAAGQVIIERAGGFIVTHDGVRLSYPASALVSPYNPQFCATSDWRTAKGLIDWVESSRADHSSY